MKKEFLNFIINETQKIKFDAVQVLKDVLCRLCEKKLPFFDDNDKQQNLKINYKISKMRQKKSIINTN